MHGSISGDDLQNDAKFQLEVQVYFQLQLTKNKKLFEEILESHHTPCRRRKWRNTGYLCSIHGGLLECQKQYDNKTKLSRKFINKQSVASNTSWSVSMISKISEGCRALTRNLEREHCQERPTGQPGTLKRSSGTGSRSTRHAALRWHMPFHRAWRSLEHGRTVSTLYSSIQVL